MTARGKVSSRTGSKGQATKRSSATRLSPRTGAKGPLRKPVAQQQAASRALGNIRPPRPGPGRPRKATAPRNDAQVVLATAIERTEQERDAAAEAYATDLTVTGEIRLLRAELAVDSAWAAFLRAQGDHTHSLKYGDRMQKVAGRIAALRELQAVDQLEELLSRAKREDALAKP